MARTLSAAAKAAIFAQESGEVAVVLLTVTHPSFAAPIRVCSNTEAVTSRGNTFQSFPFDIIFPDDSDGAPPMATLTIDNVDRSIIAELRKVSSGPPQVVLELVLASSPDTLEAGPMTFDLDNAEADQGSIRGQLKYEDFLNEPYPARKFEPSNTPGLFAI